MRYSCSSSHRWNIFKLVVCVGVADLSARKSTETNSSAAASLKGPGDLSLCLLISCHRCRRHKEVRTCMGTTVTTSLHQTLQTELEITAHHCTTFHTVGLRRATGLHTTPPTSPLTLTTTLRSRTWTLLSHCRLSSRLQDWALAMQRRSATEEPATHSRGQTSTGHSRY